LPADAHHLADEALARIFDAEVAPWLFTDALSSPNPLLILVGGQPGGGKTRAGEDIARETREPVVPIIGDELRQFHPAYETLLTENPEQMPGATAQASAAWVERSLNYAAERKISVLVEGTFRRAEVTVETARQFKSEGYRVEAHVLAVPASLSLASIEARYELDRAARFTPKDAHDASLAGMLVTVQALSTIDGAVDRLVVRTRERIVFDGRRKYGHAIEGAIAALQNEWARAPDVLP
jgi:UDP-N-acetylglucosamine kinase